MTATVRHPLRLLGTALRALLLMTLLTGVLYPLVITGVAQGLFAGRADGSLVEHDGRTVGSALIGQSWELPDGGPDPRWFQARPSAGDYDGMASGASNLAATDERLAARIEARRSDVAAFNGVRSEAVPADALTSSASGLDPHVSPAYARLQAPRVAAENGLMANDVRALVERHVQGRTLGFLGEPRVNVLLLNRELAALVRR